MNFPGHTDSLNRHQQRREAGVATVSVLCGTAGLALDEGRRWAEQGGRSVLLLGTPQFEGILEAWVDHLSPGRDLGRDAIAWLARHSDRSTVATASIEELASQLRRMTPFERTALFDATLAEASTSSAGAVCCWLLERWARGEAIAGPGLTSRLGEAFARFDGAGGCEPIVAALRELIPLPRDPVLLLARENEETRSAAWVEAAAQSLSRIALWQPTVPTLLALEAGELDDYGRRAPESRAKALIRSGVIAVRGVGEAEIVRRLDSEAVPEATARLSGSVRRLVADGASSGLVSLFVEAARAAKAVSAHSSEEGNDPARSAAERFLFERLSSLPATAGLFELNVALDFRFGPSRAMEVDLFARSLGLAVEIDGYYHFQDLDAYRRDRRKDFELQKRGYLVVRVLAEDVVARLEDVLGIILEAVASRGGRNTHRQRGEAS
ncbi:Protein of unknown function [Singulisphaera sp. GP187]|uniref:DUF559 domain-containing protein n=1 Tax=Singulisphaera sp. GP187 TaxID=1882752 RepID=UPI000929B866|nr:DUF559 domain-containing protein [Singulisphaera sp. GP187]SIO23866.1 Protein of unknown function [Singulisphaera sp. GP187]